VTLVSTFVACLKHMLFIYSLESWLLMLYSRISKNKRIKCLYSIHIFYWNYLEMIKLLFWLQKIICQKNNSKNKSWTKVNIFWRKVDRKKTNKQSSEWEHPKKNLFPKDHHTKSIYLLYQGPQICWGLHLQKWKKFKTNQNCSLLMTPNIWNWIMK
jgi:hypothetical protein